MFLHERPYRLQALLDARHWEGGAAEWFTPAWFKAAGAVWTDSEGPGINAHIWRSEVFDRYQSRLTMEDDDCAFFNALPDIVIVYRGADSKLHARGGLAWTTNREKAEWFARRFGQRSPHLATISVSKTKIAAGSRNAAKPKIWKRRSAA